jgi:hypothetical protein
MKPTKRQLEILRKMRDDDEELIYAQGRAFVDMEPTSGRTVFALLRLMAIRKDQYSDLACERYSINDTGRQILKEHGL